MEKPTLEDIAADGHKFIELTEMNVVTILMKYLI